MESKKNELEILEGMLEVLEGMIPADPEKYRKEIQPLKDAVDKLKTEVNGGENIAGK